MRFTVDPELELFAESVRGAIGGWEAPLEPVFGAWQDDRDDALAARLADVGWGELWRIRRCSAQRLPAGSSSAARWRHSRSSTRQRSGPARGSTGACATARGGSTGGEREPPSTGRERCAGSTLARRRPSRDGCPSGAPSRSPTSRASPTAP